MAFVATAIGAGLGFAGVGGLTLAEGAGLGLAAGSALNASSASKNAAKTQAGSAAAANQTQWDMFNQNRTDMQPWRDAGASALGTVGTLMKPGTDVSAMLKQDPGYMSGFHLGEQAIQDSAAARGGLLSGGTMKELTRYGQDYGANKFNDMWSRYTQVAGIGQNAASSIAGYGQNTANNIAANQIGAGNAMAAGQVGSANAFSGGVQNMMGMYQNNQLMKLIARQNAGAGWNPNGTGGMTYNLP